MVALVLDRVRALRPRNVGLLATDGTIASGIYSHKNFKLVVPSRQEQRVLVRIIYAIKAGNYEDENIASSIGRFVRNLKRRGADAVVLGCSELSLYGKFLKEEGVIDPLDELAKAAVCIALDSKRSRRKFG